MVESFVAEKENVPVPSTEIVTYGQYQYRRNATGSYHRAVDVSTLNELLEFYSSHIYLSGRFEGASILNRRNSQLISIAKHELRRAKKRLDQLAYFGLLSNRPSNLLDLGCGCGALLFLWEREAVGAARGIDISMLAPPISLRLWSTGLNIQVGEILDVLSSSLSAYANSADVLAAFDVLEHIGDLESVVRLASIVLKPGGQFIVEVPVISPRWAWEDVTKFPLFYPEHHLHLFTPSGITRVFLDAGFNERYATLRRKSSKYLMIFER